MPEQLRITIPELDEFETRREKAYAKLNMAERAFTLCNTSNLAFTPADLYTEASDEISQLNSLGIEKGYIPRELPEQDNYEEAA